MAAKSMKLIALLSVIATAISAVLYAYNSVSAFLSLAITFGTIGYHLGIRLIVGTLFDLFMKNRADYTKRWYQVSEQEKKLYSKLKVKKWKDKMPTYDVDAFNAARHSWDEIAQASCQAELVHETDIVLSFIPIVFSIWFGSLAVFIITSVLGALFDLIFVIIQRYNRPRLLKMVNKSKR